MPEDRPPGAHEWKRAAAAYAADWISADEIYALALRSLKAGDWSYALDDILSSTDLIMSDVGPWFGALLKEREILVPEREPAITTLIAAFLRDIVEGTLAPRVAMAAVVELERESERPKTRHVGEAHGLHALIGTYYSCDDADERAGQRGYSREDADRDLAELESSIVSLARNWLAQHDVDGTHPPRTMRP